MPNLKSILVSLPILLMVALASQQALGFDGASDPATRKPVVAKKPTHGFRVKRISFRGNRSVAHAVRLHQIRSVSRTDRSFDPSQLDADIRRLTVLYYRRGFRNIDVSCKVVVDKKRKYYSLYFYIAEIGYL